MTQMQFPSTRPPCFNTDAQWEDYKRLSRESARRGFTYCSDCTPEYQEKMKAKGLCRHPYTSFVKHHNVVTGRRDQPVIDHNGEAHPVGVWAQKLGISKQTILMRLARGWTKDRALSVKSAPQ